MGNCDYGGFDYDDWPDFAEPDGPLSHDDVRKMFLGVSIILILSGLACFGLAAWLAS